VSWLRWVRFFSFFSLMRLSRQQSHLSMCSHQQEPWRRSPLESPRSPRGRIIRIKAVPINNLVNAQTGQVSRQASPTTSLQGPQISDFLGASERSSGFSGSSDRHLSSTMGYTSRSRDLRTLTREISYKIVGCNGLRSFTSVAGTASCSPKKPVTSSGSRARL
jgi:hypothetical protein